MKLKECKFCGKRPSSFHSTLKIKDTYLSAWITECEIDEEQEKFPFAEHRITVYGANQEESETRWNLINS